MYYCFYVFCMCHTNNHWTYRSSVTTRPLVQGVRLISPYCYSKHMYINNHQSQAHKCQSCSLQRMRIYSCFIVLIINNFIITYIFTYWCIYLCLSSDAPPSYDSMFGELAQKKAQSDGVVDFTKEAAGVMNKKASGICGLIVCGIFCAILGAALPITEIVIGGSAILFTQIIVGPIISGW